MKEIKAISNCIYREREGKMADRYMMEGHKLFWHLDRVNDWLKDKPIVPLLIDGGLHKNCNIRCEYCFPFYVTDNTGSRNSYFPREPLLRYLKDAVGMGVKAVAFFGEGEPFLNPHAYEAIITGKKAGLDMSIGTNGILMDTGIRGEEILECLTYVKFNISAASEQAYIKIHRSKEFNAAVSKIKFCADTKRKKNLSVTLGLQMVLTPNNIDQAVPLAKLGKTLGVDYLQIKPCSDTQESSLGVFSRYGEYDKAKDMLTEAEKSSTEDYRVIVKWDTFSTVGTRNYDRCLGARFIIHNSGDGKLYPCGRFMNYKEEEYRLGDLTKQSFREIIESKRYEEVMQKVEELDVHKVCHSLCRTGMVNDFLWSLKHPPMHVNFI